MLGRGRAPLCHRFLVIALERGVLCSAQTPIVIHEPSLYSAVGVGVALSLPNVSDNDTDLLTSVVRLSSSTVEISIILITLRYFFWDRRKKCWSGFRNLMCVRSHVLGDDGR